MCSYVNENISSLLASALPDSSQVIARIVEFLIIPVPVVIHYRTAITESWHTSVVCNILLVQSSLYRGPDITS